MDNIIESSEEDYLYTKNSQIQNSGKGLFTAIPIYKEEIIAVFKGNVLNTIQAKAIAEKNEDQYFINLLDGKTLDSKYVECFAKYANDASGYSKSVFKNNAKIALDENKNVCLIALRKIKAGEEIFCSYGKKYWKQYI